MATRDKNMYFILAVLLAVFINSCAITPKDGTGELTDRAPLTDKEEALSLLTGWEFLKGNEKEKAGYGLYNYLLLGGCKGQIARKRCLATINGLLQPDQFPKITEFENYNYPPKKLSVIYIPIKENVIVPDKPTAKWVLKHYDTARTQIFLDSLSTKHDINGQYIVSSQEPLTLTLNYRNKPMAGEYITQNLSGLEPTLISSWLSKFKSDIYQNRIWDDDSKFRDLPFLLQSKIEAAAREFYSTINNVGKLIDTLLVIRDKFLSLSSPSSSG